MPVKTAQIAGAAVNSKRQPMTDEQHPRHADRNGGPANDAGGAQLRPDGTFVIRNLEPGEYTLRAQQFKQGDRPEIATAAVTLAGHDVDGLQFVVVPPSTASGVVLVDPAAAATIKVSSIVLMVSPVDLQPGLADTSARPKDDFTFDALMQPGTNMVRMLSDALPEWR